MNDEAGAIEPRAGRPPVALLTGGSSGIGRALLDELLRAQWQLGVVSRRAPEEWQLGAPPHAASHWTWLRGDLRRPVQLCERVNAWLENLDGLDAMIHCAASYGSSQRHCFEETGDQELDEVMDTNLRGPFVLTRFVLPRLIAKSRALLMTLSSDVAIGPAPGRVAYGCSKAGLHALVTGLSEELKGSSVSVVECVPAAQVDTPGIRRRRPDDFDPSDYASPVIIARQIAEIVESRGHQLHGQRLVLEGSP